MKNEIAQALNNLGHTLGWCTFWFCLVLAISLGSTQR